MHSMSWIKILLRTKHNLIFGMVILLISLIMLINFLFNEWSQWKDLKKTESQLQVEIERNKERKLANAITNKTLPFRSSSIKNYLPTLYSVAQNSGVQVKKLHVLPSQKMAGQLIPFLELVAMGGFSEISHFLSALHNNFSIYLMTDLSLDVVRDNLLELKVKILFIESAKMERSVVMFDELSSPFCLSSTQVPVFGNVNNLEKKPQAYKLIYLKQVGLIQVNKKEKSLIRLPDNQIIEAEVGDVLGREHAIVMQITKTETQLLLPNKHYYIIRS